MKSSDFTAFPSWSTTSKDGILSPILSIFLADFLAEREDGDKTFGCYIFDVNAYRLSDPDCVPKDEPLYLPDPSYFNIDADDPSSVRKARNHGAKLLKPKQ